MDAEAYAPLHKQGDPLHLLGEKIIVDECMLEKELNGLFAP